MVRWSVGVDGPEPHAPDDNAEPPATLDPETAALVDPRDEDADTEGPVDEL